MTRFARRGDVLSRSFGDEVFLARRDRDGVDALEGTAAAIWDTLDRPASADEVAQTLADACSVDVGTIASDVETFLVELTDRGWLVEVGNDG